MINESMKNFGEAKSIIRDIAEYSRQRKNEIGEENVFDFSLGNPSVPSPEIVNSTLIDLIKNTEPEKLHGYTSSTGDLNVRCSIADYIKNEFDFPASPDNLYMTSGAAASLAITLNAIINKGDEIIILAPYFPEYKVFISKAGGVAVELKLTEPSFDIPEEELKSVITKNTKAIIINSPNNPTGVVFKEESIKKISEILSECEKKYNSEIFIIADEPYRELVYDGITVPYIPHYYDNTVVCYSFSKSLSLPGERIGYVFVSPNVKNYSDVFSAVCGAGRALGYVCATSIFQYLIPYCLGKTSDISIYDRNRNLLYSSLCEYGYECIHPDGAFYLFVKSPVGDANKFCEIARKYELMLVPGDSFGITGYVRIAYCVKTETVEKSLPCFKALINDIKKDKVK